MLAFDAKKTARGTSPVGHQDYARHLNTSSLVCLIIAASAPLTVLAGGVPTNFAVSGSLGVPLSYIALGLVLICFSVGYGTMAASIENAGAFYSYIERGLGSRHGAAGALLATVSYSLMQIGLYGIFGFSLANFLNQFLTLELPWWAAAGIGWLIAGILGVRNVATSAKLITVLVAAEILIVLIISAVALAVAPSGATLDTLKPHQFFNDGLGVMLSFSVAAFMGFESGAVYAAETKNPQQTVPRATNLAIAIIAIFYSVTTWALAQGVGPGAVIELSRKLGPDLLFTWVQNYSLVISVVANALFITSLLAALVAFHNTTARYVFTLGDKGILPKIATLKSADGAPIVGSLLQSGVALIIVGAFAILDVIGVENALFPVVTLFTWFTNAAALGLVFLLLVTSVSISLWLKRQTNVYSKSKQIFSWASTLGLFGVFALMILHFPKMIGDYGGPTMILIMPSIIAAAGICGYFLPNPKKKISS